MEDFLLKMWLELKPHLFEFLPFIGGFALGVLPSIFKKKQESDYLRFKAEGIKLAKRRPVLMMDGTKRKSLQPANQQPIPQGWDTIKAEIQRDESGSPVKKNKVHPRKHTPPIEKPFEHKFFGTQLIIEGKIIIGGLNRSKHRLEIVGNQMFIDNNQVKINEGDLEHIKDMIRKSRI